MNYSKFISFLSILVLSTLLSCNGDDAPTPQEEAFKLLAGDWGFGSNGRIVLDNQDISLNFAGFKLSFTDGGYTTTNAGNLFSASGTWSWVNQEARKLILDSGEEFTIEILTTSQFKFSFYHTGSSASGISGNYTIHVSK